MKLNPNIKRFSDGDIEITHATGSHRYNRKWMKETNKQWNQMIQERLNMIEHEVCKCGLCGKDWHAGVDCTRVDVTQQQHYTALKNSAYHFYCR